MAGIEAVASREILDSRGNPTVEVEVLLDDGTFARAGVPSGASTGAFEAVERRDGDKDRYSGKGVADAVAAVSEIIEPEIVGMEAEDQRFLDQTLRILTAPPTRARSAQTPFLVFPLQLPRQRQSPPAFRSTSTSVARTRTCCPFR